MAPKPKLMTIHAEHTTPALAVAELVTTILKHTLCSSLVELLKRLEAGDETVSAKLATLILDEAQVALIEAEHEVAGIVRIGPTVSITECDGCHRVTAVEGTPPRACGVTLGCEGKLTKSTMAKKTPFKEPA